MQLPVACKQSPASDLLNYGNHNYGAQTRHNNNTKSWQSSSYQILFSLLWHRTLHMTYNFIRNAVNQQREFQQHTKQVSIMSVYTVQCTSV